MSGGKRRFRYLKERMLSMIEIYEAQVYIRIHHEDSATRAAVQYKKTTTSRLFLPFKEKQSQNNCQK